MNSSRPGETHASWGSGTSVPRHSASRHWAVLAVLLGIACLTGCSSLSGLRDNLAYNDTMNDFVLGWRNSVWARQSWNERKYMFVGEPQFVAFGQGYRDGYADVAGGANGCVPGLPPRHYWTWKYQTGEGQAKVAAWFAGYPYGAAAAKEDGAGNFQQIQVSHLIDAQYSPEFQAGICPGCDPTALPGGTKFEVLPSDGEPVPVPTPVAPTPVINPTTYVAPTDLWPSEALPRTAPTPTSNTPYRSNAVGAVVPAAAQIPIPLK